jgi:hypothetical protein
MIFDVRFNVVPSPSEHVVVTKYEDSVFPKFQQLFEVPPEHSRLKFLALDPAESSTALVIENRSGNAITAFCYRWIRADSSGKQRPHKFTSDSYMVDVYRPVMPAGARVLLTQSGIVNEQIIDHFEAGGGCIGGGTRARMSPEPEIVALTFQIDFILFEDGEISGPDPNRYAISLQCRKKAAEFVAQQVRLADAEGRDVTPVLLALVKIPHFGSLHHEQGDRLVQWTQHYAKHYLDTVKRHPSTGVNWREAALRHLENRPELPRFFRRDQPS